MKMERTKEDFQCKSRRQNNKRFQPCWKNSSVTFSLHCLLSSQGLQGLQMSAHFRAICTEWERTLDKSSFCLLRGGGV